MSLTCSKRLWFCTSIFFILPEEAFTDREWNPKTFDKNEAMKKAYHDPHPPKDVDYSYKKALSLLKTFSSQNSDSMVQERLADDITLWNLIFKRLNSIELSFQRPVVRENGLLFLSLPLENVNMVNGDDSKHNHELQETDRVDIYGKVLETCQAKSRASHAALIDKSLHDEPLLEKYRNFKTEATIKTLWKKNGFDGDWYVGEKKRKVTFPIAKNGKSGGYKNVFWCDADRGVKQDHVATDLLPLLKSVGGKNSIAWLGMIYMSAYNVHTSTFEDGKKMRKALASAHTVALDSIKTATQ